MAEKTEMETTLNALERAIIVLSGAGTKTALLQTEPKDEMTLLSVAVGVHEAIKMLPNDRVISPKQLALIKAFAKDPAEFYDQKAEKAASYNPASGTIQGILKDMYDTFSMNLEKEGEKADAEKDLADTSQALDDTTKQMKADTAFFDETKAACQTKADEWNERVRARTEELAGINKALEILTGDDAKALFSKAIKPGVETFFLQESTSLPTATKAINV